ncbi:nuclear transport factor 2 family protein [Novosphingobium beihaiensis]|nr:nuclear transport factor 2 family protein [Novosphingobium beihaiensis]
MYKPLTSPSLTAAITAFAIAAAQPAWAETPPRYDQVTQASTPVADAYFAAYIARDWDKLETLLDDEASFQDESAELVFGGLRSQGKAAMMKRFREGYASLTHMSFKPQRTFHAGHIAIYEGDLDWGLDIGDGVVVESETPMVVILRVEDGKIVRHRDNVDYAPFLARLRALRAQS